MGWKLVRDRLRVVDLSKNLRVLGDSAMLVVARVSHYSDGLRAVPLMRLYADGRPPQMVTVLGSEERVENLMRGNRLKELHEVYRRAKDDMPALQELMKAPDEFNTFIPVYSLDATGALVLDYCEVAELGEVTHAGVLIEQHLLYPSVLAAITAQVTQCQAAVTKMLEAVEPQLSQMRQASAALSSVVHGMQNDAPAAESQSCKELWEASKAIADHVDLALTHVAMASSGAALRRTMAQVERRNGPVTGFPAPRGDAG